MPSENIDLKAILREVLKIQRRQEQCIRQVYVDVENIREYLKSRYGKDFEREFSSLSGIAELQMSLEPRDTISKDIDKLIELLTGSKYHPTPSEALPEKDKEGILDAADYLSGQAKKSS